MTAAEATRRAAATRKAATQGLRAFYSRPLGWLALIVTSVFLAYGGGGVMYWFHAIYRGEQGPAINDWYHWLFDSSLGFAALTPVLFFILPGALWAISRAGVKNAWLKAGGYVVLVGVLFGVLTGPGPLLHNALVGRGTALGRLAENIFGTEPSIVARNAHAGDHSLLSEVVLQVVVGVPVYILAGLLALLVVRALSSRRSRV